MDVVSPGGGEQARINCLSQVGGGVVSARCGAAGLREPSPTTTWCEREDELDGGPLVGECGGGWLAGCSKEFRRSRRLMGPEIRHALIQP